MAKNSRALPALAIPEAARQDVAQDGQLVLVHVLKPEAEYFTLAEAADFVRLSSSLLYKLTSAGKLRPARIGSKLVFSREVLVQFMASAERRPVIIDGKAGKE